MTAPQRPQQSQFLRRPSLKESKFLAEALRTETVGGLILLAAAVVALVFANSALSGTYEDIKSFTFGPSALDLRLDLAHWAKDGLLTVFFFVVGVELKRELVDGELRDPRAAALPIIAALCGMATPAAVYVAVNAGRGDLNGWAIPTATDIAFALAVLAVIGSNLPSALRAFLLTLAVVDDLFAILIIAIFYTAGINLVALGFAAAGLVLFWFLQRHDIRGWYVYVPLALVIWALMHASGVHATIAGVAMGLMLRVTTRPGEEVSPGERIEHQTRPLSAGLAVPVFAFFAAGVSVNADSIGGVFTDPEPLGVVLGLIIGKIVGITLGSRLAVRFTRAELNPALSWPDVFAVATLAGIGFTVSLLISELAFAEDVGLAEETKAAVLMGSFIAAVLACVMLRIRDNRYKAIAEEDERDDDRDGIPDMYQQDDPEYHLRMAVIYEAKAAEHRRRAETRHPPGDPGDGRA